MKITDDMVERAARAIYRHGGWDRRWNEIAPEGRGRFRTAAREALSHALSKPAKKRTLSSGKRHG